MFSCYVTRYNPEYIRMFWKIYDDIFPFLWPLRSMGKEQFDKFQKLSKLTTTASKIVIALALITSTGGLPWYGDEYYVFLPVKIAVDYFDAWSSQIYLIIFYSSFYHISLTIISNVFFLAYLGLHLYNQLEMLDLRLRNLLNGPDLNCALEDTAYQEFVNAELISCIKLHQILLKL